MPAERPFRDRGETGFHLIETMHRDADGTIARLELHLARLRTSAEALGFACETGTIAARLAGLGRTAGPQRIRLTLEPDGRSDIQTAPFVPVAPDTVWTLAIASVRLASTDHMLRHKTSRRGAYEAARSEFSRNEADEVLLLNEKGQLCEGTITSLFARLDDGPMVTPPLECGLLAGVLRAEMIAQGRAREQVITPEDALAARELFVGNALRGLVPARLSMKMGG